LITVIKKLVTSLQQFIFQLTAEWGWNMAVV